MEAALSFLWAGAPSEIPSWGNIIAIGQQFVEFHPWMAIPAGAALTATVLAMNILGDGLRDLLDPKVSRIAREKR